MQGRTAQPGRVVTFGESMLRYTPPGNKRLELSEQLNVTVGGAEMNTAATLACLNTPATWISQLPDTPLGRSIARQAHAAGVDVSEVSWVPESFGRTGIYYLEEATDPRPSAVYYDRADSAFARMTPGTFDWPAILEGASAFHVSGITPAVSAGARAETMTAIRAANAHGVPVSFDLNFRSKLWTEAEARACFLEIAPLVTILFASRGNIRTFFGISGEYEEVMRTTRERLGVSVVVLSRKKSKASRSVKVGCQAMGPDGETVTGEWRSVEVVDRLGGGDAFAGGFLAGYVRDHDDLARAVALGGAAQALKHTMPGDLLTATAAEIEANVLDSDGGVLQR